MSLCGIGWCPSWEGVEVPILSSNSSTRLIRPNSFPLMGECDSSRQKLCSRIRCSLSIKNATSLGSEEVADDTTSASLEEELGHVMKFKMSDFKICDRVSIGLSGRTDEIVFEALVKDVHSPLHNSRVVLRQLSSTQAQRRGKRAIEVLKKLARRRLMYHSYSMQVHGYVDPSTSGDYGSFTLVHGYHGSFSLRHWLQQSDWLPTLEATLALDEESVRRVGDDTVGGSAVSRQLRLVRLLMRDLLIGVNYLHSHGLAHTELRLENVHVSPVDRHIKVGILGNAADFYDNNPNTSTTDGSMDRRQMMIAFDMRCVGFMMAKMVLQELMEPLIFTKFKSFLTKGNDPSCLREFLLQTLRRNSSSGNAGLQILNRNWGAGWNLLSLLLAAKPSERISCLDALRHPFLCGPRWRVDPSMDIIRWGLGSTAVRITEEYIYGHQQRSRLAHFIELMEMLNPHSKPKNWMALLPGKWRLLYSTGRHIGLTLRQPPARVLIGDVHLTMSRTPKSNTTLSFTSDISFTVLIGQDWPHDKAGVVGKLGIDSSFRLTAGKRLYLKEGKDTTFLPSSSNTEDSIVKKLSGKRWRKALPFKEFPSSLPVAKLISSEVEVTMSLNDPLGKNVDAAKNAVHEVRTQVPPEMFDLSKLVCGTYVDARLLVLRGVSGSALLFTRSCANGSCRC
ncbi:probable plastid-lipid-associated protein 14, chloroplastic isoform X1 [Actinidia eriantha]|uniref:probable plastid-lipid-associated protein 14, chloroplastic isoform X1 n=1 Tax=Actinidia eriantha TaxID=165200 RepID=UPI0025899F46|nr:probable plastid-lipid-associated protein 14, chloroplastic isoform X1 [Actinidia eriantha]